MDLQQLIILGRATRDGEKLSSKDGKNYAKFSLAVNEYFSKTKDERTTFYEVLVFNKSVEKADTIKKGSLVMVQGRPEVDAYLSKNGEAKANLVVFADKWKLIGKK